MKFYQKNLREVYGETLVELGETHKNVVVLDADLNTSTCTSFFKAKFPERFIQCGIAEANMFSIASGMAHLGYVPFPSTFAAFVTRKALDPLFMNISCQNLSVKIPGSYPGLTATECGPSHCVCDDISTIRGLPNIKIVDAGDNYELAEMMRTIVTEEGPVYFRVPKAELPQLFDQNYKFQWGRGYTLRTGGDITLASTGMMTGIALRAAEILENDNISATVLHLPTIKPLDEALLVQAAKRTGRVLTIENGRVYGGFGSAVAETLCREHPTHVEIMGIGDEPARSSDLGTLLRHHRLTPQDMADRAVQMIVKT